MSKFFGQVLDKDSVRAAVREILEDQRADRRRERGADPEIYLVCRKDGKFVIRGPREEAVSLRPGVLISLKAARSELGHAERVDEWTIDGAKIEAVGFDKMSRQSLVEWAEDRLRALARSNGIPTSDPASAD